MTAGGNLIKYHGEITARTEYLTISKVLWNSFLSTKEANFMGINIGNFYLGTPMDRYEYMKIPLSIFTQHIIYQYDLHSRVRNRCVYHNIRRAIYGLPQAGALANVQLQKIIATAGYYKISHTPGLWRHITRPIQFTFLVDDFGVKYVG